MRKSMSNVKVQSPKLKFEILILIFYLAFACLPQAGNLTFELYDFYSPT